MYFVYFLTNKRLNVLYVGVTNDLLRRVFEHKNKNLEGFTKKYNVNRLVYYEYHDDIKLAILREKQVKNWSRNKKNALVNSKNPLWKDLYRELL